MHLLLLPILKLLSLLSKWTVGPSDAEQACQSLLSTLPGLISFPGSEIYEKSISSYAFIGTRLRPTCLATPKTTEHVATIIKILSTFDTVAFAIRSGGHNTNKGFADVKDGVTIDLSAMNQVRVERAANIVSVGPGARWQNVYDVTDTYDLAVQGGRNGDVGVGGFLTGGGIGFFSLDRGWACDSVANFEVVLSNGEVVNANRTSHADLFAALKGGLNNFGVVTRFDLITFASGPMWGGVVIYPNSTDTKLLDALATVKDPGNFDPHAMFVFGFIYDAAQSTFTANIAMYHSQPARVGASALNAFTTIKPQLFNSIRIGSPGEFAGEKVTPITKSYYMDWSTTTIVVSRRALSLIHASFKRNSLALTNLYAPANLTIALSIQSVPSAATASNPNSLGFHPLSQPEKRLLNIGIAFRYDDPAVAVGLDRALKDFTAELDRIAIVEGVSDKFLYLNYAGSWQDVLSGYGSRSLTEMRNVAKQYDRSGMFQKQVPGGYKLYE